MGTPKPAGTGSVCQEGSGGSAPEDAREREDKEKSWDDVSNWAKLMNDAQGLLLDAKEKMRSNSVTMDSVTAALGSATEVLGTATTAVLEDVATVTSAIATH